MADDIRTFVDAQPMVDVHEHHMPEGLLEPDVGLLQMFEQSYAGWTRQRPYPLPSEEPPPSILDRGGETTWDDLAGYLEGSGSNAFVRNLVRALSDLYDLGDEGITRDNWRALDGEMRRRHADPTWAPALLERVGVLKVIRA